MSNLREPGSFKNTQVVPQPRDALRERTGSFLPTRPAGAGALEGTKVTTLQKNRHALRTLWPVS